MKKVLTTMMILMLFNLQIVLAHPPHAYDYNLHNASTFEIKLTGSGFITVAIDGEYFPEPVKRFSINNITAGNHFVEIFKEKVQHSGYYSNTQNELIFSGKVYITPASLVSGVVDNFGRFFIKDVRQLMSYNENPNMPDNHYSHQPALYSGQYYTTPMPMQEPAFAQLLDIMNEQWYDDTKLQVAQQAIQSNWFTSSQVARMMHIMWFEDSKLDLAKSAYIKVVDKSDFYLVNKEFWFNNSVESLSKYVFAAN